MSEVITVSLTDGDIYVTLDGGLPEATAAAQAAAAAAELAAENLSYNSGTGQLNLGPAAASRLVLYGVVWSREGNFGDVIIGNGAGNSGTSAGARVVIGYQAGVVGNLATDERQVIIGYIACNQASGNRAWIAIGDRAGEYAQNTIDCTVVGSEAGRMIGRWEPPIYNVPDDEDHILAADPDPKHGLPLPPNVVGGSFFGKNSGRYNTIGLNNTGFGDSTLGFTTTGSLNTAIGYICGEGNVHGEYNTFGGAGVRRNMYSGDENALWGAEIGAGVGTAGGGVVPGGSRNSGVGRSTQYVWQGDDVSTLGYHALYNLAAGTGGDIAIGAEAGLTVTTGGDNVFIGHDAGNHGSQKVDPVNSIAIGAGTYTTLNNQIVIGNEDTIHTYLRHNVRIFGGNSGDPLFPYQVWVPADYGVGKSRLNLESDIVNGWHFFSWDGASVGGGRLKFSLATVEVAGKVQADALQLDAGGGTAPASAGATGTAGEIRWDSGFIYVCTATNTWKRVAIATW